VNLKQELYKFLKEEIGDRRVFIHPLYPGELLIAYGLKEYGPLVLLTEENPLKVAQDGNFLFDRLYLLSSETLPQAASAIASGDFDLLVLDEKSLGLEIPKQDLIKLKVGSDLSRDEFLYCLDEGGIQQRYCVYEKGEYVKRGGIIDVWSVNSPKPLRIELEGDKIASLRFFEPSSQLSTEKIREVNLLIKRQDFEPLEEAIKGFFKIGPEIPGYKADLKFHPMGNSIPFIPASSFHRNLDQFKEEIRSFSGYRVFIVVDTPGEIQRLRDLFEDEFPEIEYINAFLSKGFVIDKSKIVLYTESDIFGLLRARREEVRKRIQREEKGVFNQGDFVVHEDFGIGRFQGLERVEIDRREMDCLAIEYKNNSRVLIPVKKANLLTQYIAGGEKEPEISELSQKKWERKKGRIMKGLKEYAESLLSLYARRTASEGYPFSMNDSLQRDLELSFPFRETRDQIESIRKVYQEMEDTKVMDRLLCGEVGFGKTEVALRAAFKAVRDSKQVAILAPTTILAEQHYRTFTNRLERLPVNVELLSRFTKVRGKEIKQRMKTGECDIVIGTHKLLDKSILFKDLGLVIIDEEQRFGVKQKEKLKELRVNVDTLSMSATPIPRTLQFSLLGIRDLSVIQTPPEGRKGVITTLIHWDSDVIRDAILKEIERGGQVFFVHNRIRDIELIRMRLEKIVPEVSIVIGHGQLPTQVLEKRMTDFLECKYDLLLCTSIIESGLDLPNVNTIIIDRAEDFGLADLHQLRGRVGRSIRQGFCYLIIPRGLKGKARDRISAIRTYSELGSGFKISLRDLEIRGAGEILGSKQHGHIAAVGYELYLKMLSNTIKEIKGEEVKKRPQVEVSLHGSFYIPHDYVPQEEERIGLYRKISSAESLGDVDNIRDEIQDRFGKLPLNLKGILRWARIRIMAGRAGIIKVEEGIKNYRCEFERKLSGDKIRKLVSQVEGLKFSYNGNLTVFVPRNSIFTFLKALNQ